MKRTVNCKMEIIPSPEKTCWIISLPEEAALETAMLLALLNQGKVPQVKFADKSRAAVIRTAPGGYLLMLKDDQITVGESWAIELNGMLMDIYFHGWSDQASLEWDFGNISLTVQALPSKG